jgi:hypothetical protein
VSPLLNVTMPTNAMVCFSTIIEIANLNIIPKEKIKEWTKTHLGLGNRENTTMMIQMSE